MNPTWNVVSQIKFRIVTGHSVRTAILESTRALENSFEEQLYLWTQRFPQPFNGKNLLSNAQIILIQLLEEGLVGKPIYEPLCQLEEDVRESILREIDEHVAKLPFLSLIPMLFFIGPALFLILIGPILYQLLKELSL